MSSSRVYLEQWVEQAAASIPRGSLVLDAGAGDSPYAHYFRDHRYESADFAQLEKAYASLTYTCDLVELPVEDERFDLVLMTQVLEHVPEPMRVLSEMRRVLKPKAEIWYSAPLFYEEHEQPYDFFRYTQFAHRKLCADAGLEIVGIDWLEGYLATVGYQLGMLASQLPTGAAAYGGGVPGAAAGCAAVLARRIARGLARACDRSDRRIKITDAGMPKNYTVRARRPA